MVNQGIAARGIGIRFAAGGTKCDVSVTAKPLALWITLSITLQKRRQLGDGGTTPNGVFPGYGN